MPGMAMMMDGETEPECYATDDFFLQSLAYCISTRCPTTPAWELERYWKMNVAGRAQYVSYWCIVFKIELIFIIESSQILRRRISKHWRKQAHPLRHLSAVILSTRPA
jgi:hypothetical protein